jgi:hypothetical protein
MVARRTVWLIVVAVAVVVTIWFAIYLVAGTGGESGPTITEIDRTNG